MDRRHLERSGWTPRAIRAASAGGRLHRVRRGWFIDRGDWDDLWPESRHRAEVLAVAQSATTTRPVFSHVSPSRTRRSHGSREIRGRSMRSPPRI
ncbi:hypothetical protein AUC47_04765 [Microbacterium sp. SZ1]|nr:hypothetical protein AUC47_04765 [Microbacterium sp. SZ1]